MVGLCDLRHVPPEDDRLAAMALLADPMREGCIQVLGMSWKPIGKGHPEPARGFELELPLPLFDLGDAARAAELYAGYLALTPSGDGAVTKWLAELKNRKAAPKVAATDNTIREVR